MNTSDNQNGKFYGNFQKKIYCWDYIRNNLFLSVNVHDFPKTYLLWSTYVDVRRRFLIHHTTLPFSTTPTHFLKW